LLFTVGVQLLAVRMILSMRTILSMHTPRPYALCTSQFSELYRCLGNNNLMYAWKIL